MTQKPQPPQNSKATIDRLLAERYEPVEEGLATHGMIELLVSRIEAGDADHVKVVSLVGGAGSGKTTIAFIESLTTAYIAEITGLKQHDHSCNKSDPKRKNYTEHEA